MSNIPKCSRETKAIMWRNIKSNISTDKKVLFAWLKPSRVVMFAVAATMLIVSALGIIRFYEQENSLVFSDLYAYTEYEESNFETSIEEFLF